MLRRLSRGSATALLVAVALLACGVWLLSKPQEGPFVLRCDSLTATLISPQTYRITVQAVLQGVPRDTVTVNYQFGDDSLDVQPLGAAEVHTYFPGSPGDTYIVTAALSTSAHGGVSVKSPRCTTTISLH